MMSATIILTTVLEQIFDSTGASPAIQLAVRWIVAAILYVIGLAIIGGEIYAIHYLLTLPMRRAERARLFLDLLEGALNRGQSAEAMIVSVAQSHDRMLGARFHLLADYVEGGLEFGRGAGPGAAFFAAANRRHAPGRRTAGRPGGGCCRPAAKSCASGPRPSAAPCTT